MKKLFSILIAILLTINFAIADEGMWLLTMLNKTYPQMKAQGFELKADDIYNLNEPSIKDAIVIFGGFCTGEIVSDKGLIFTNHHCGFGSIQAHSTLDHDYLTDGFWAQSFEEELPNPGLFVKFLVKMNDVTELALKDVTADMEETKRTEIINKNIEQIENTALAGYPTGEGYEANVQSFFNNNQYFLIIYQKFTDIRLVGAPPSSIGKFGGDTDNWMWTRHTGDFSIFRVYASADGKPADYSTDNVPLKPKYSLPVSLKGVQENDYTMILGFPGRTNRYATTYDIQETMTGTNDNRAKIRGIRQEILMEDMLADQNVYIKYASKYARSSNYWKYSIGQNQGLKKLNVIKKKKDIENNFTQWLRNNPAENELYKDVLPTIKSVYNDRSDNNKAYIYIRECLISGTEYIYFAQKSKKIYDALKNGNKTNLATAVEDLRTQAEVFFKDYNAPTDKKSALAMLNLFTEDINAQFYPTFIAKAKSDFNSFDAYIEDVFKRSIFVDKDKFEAFLNDPKIETLEQDPAYIAANSTYEKISEINAFFKPLNEKLVWAKRLWLEGLMKLHAGQLMYPDANFTMRLTYGTVGGYSPRDGVDYKYFTTIDGIIEKYDPNNPEFVLPDKLIELYQTQDYGQYFDADGKLHVCFLSNNDITGGNSGSPILNSKGELIGLAFDGNWEAMSGDIAFEPDLQRTINVDIRYVLWVVEKIGGCNRIIDELTLMK
ncbi:MAG: S46 family peptidase [Bacteroidales bacterium]|nr:S46 family peptidase [Bacteroidales bacterium]